MWDVLERGLRGEPAPLAVGGVAEWFDVLARELKSDTSPADAALLGGLLADRVGYAFTAGYQAALRALLPDLPADHRTSLCATESGGNHPRAIRTNIRMDSDGVVVSGHKRWSTLAPLAERLLVVAARGDGETRGDVPAGRPQLVVVCVPAGAHGVKMQPMPETPFVPEIPHAEIELHDVRLPDDAVLPGDGYQTVLKPFRTIEDAHVHLALLGYLLSAARRSGAEQERLEQIAAAIVTAHALAEAPVAQAGVHVALAGLLEGTRAVADAITPTLVARLPEEGARFQRDRGLLAVAQSARDARRKRAWERLLPASSGPQT